MKSSGLKLQPEYDKRKRKRLLKDGACSDEDPLSCCEIPQQCGLTGTWSCWLHRHPVDGRGGVSSTLLLPVTHHQLRSFADIDLEDVESAPGRQCSSRWWRAVRRDAGVPTVPEFHRELWWMKLIIYVCCIKHQRGPFHYCNATAEAHQTRWRRRPRIVKHRII